MSVFRVMAAILVVAALVYFVGKFLAMVAEGVQ